MRSMKSYNKDRKGTIISLLLLCFVLTLSVGYSVMNKELTISTEAAFRVEKDIRVTGISLKGTTNSGIEEYKSQFSTDIIKVGVTLPNKNSTVVYKVKVTNYSNAAMKLTSITKSIENSNYNITFNKTIPLLIGKLSEEEIEITFKNNTNTSQTINSVLLFTFAKNEAMMVTGNENASTGTFYRGSLTKESIEKITFVASKDVPNDAIGYWDCSYTSGANQVIAYYLDEDENGLYELYIGADGEVYAPSDSRTLFMNFTAVTEINFNHVVNGEKMTQVTSQNAGSLGMFRNCTSLVRLDVSDFTFSKVTMLGYANSSIFYGCKALTSLDLHTWNVSNITSMRRLFDGCSALESINLNGWDTSNVTDMSYMFNSCSSLTVLNVNHFNTSNVTNLTGTFRYCSQLSSINLSNWNTSNLITMGSDYLGGTFYSCSALTNLDLHTWDTSKVTTMNYAFGKCTALVNVNLSGWDTSSLTRMNEMFSSCTSLTSLDLSSFTTESLTNCKTVFYQCTSLASLDIRNMDFEDKNIDTSNMFYSAYSGITVYVKNEYNKNYIKSIKASANVIIA